MDKPFNIHDWQAKQRLKEADDRPYNWRELPGYNPDAFYGGGAEEETKDISKDAQKIADHPLLDKINTKDEWVDVMKALMDHGKSIPAVSDSIKKTTLLDMVKTIGKEETPENGEL